MWFEIKQDKLQQFASCTDQQGVRLFETKNAQSSNSFTYVVKIAYLRWIFGLFFSKCAKVKSAPIKSGSKERDAV